MVGHDMREPLRPVTGRDGEIIREDVQGKRFQFVQEVDRNVRNCMPMEKETLLH